MSHDGVPVGGIAVALMLGTYALLDLVPSLPVLGLGFCGTVLIYQLDRVLAHSPEDQVNRPQRTRWMRAHKQYVYATMVGSVMGGIMLLPMVRTVTILIGIGLGLAGGLHVCPVLRGGHRLKAWGRLKPVSISGVWALGGVLLPVVEAGHDVTSSVGALIGYRFGLVVVNTLLADWQDRRGDARAGLHTVATTGRPGALFGAAYVLLGILMAGGIGVVAAGYAPLLLLVDLVGVLLMGGIVWRVQHDARGAHHIAIDAVVAWPAITFLVAWLGGG